MINKFIANIIAMGFYNIFLYATVLILIHQGIAQLLAKIEKMHGVAVKFYLYSCLFMEYMFIRIN